MGYVNKTYLSTQFKNFADKIAKVFSKIGHTHLKSDITDFPTSMPANGGNAATVGGHTVGVNVPSNAKFTDTTYGVATSSVLGLVKSGTDITVDSSGNVSVNDDSHNHVINNVDGLQSALDGKLSKTTYEYNKELALGSSGKVCIGVFPCYDSNISVEIKSTTNTTYNGTLIIATQNINTSLGGTYSATVYGDEKNTLTSAIKIQYLSGSNAFSVYINLPSWSKNILHIQCVSLAGTPSSIATVIDSIPSTATIVPTNAFTHTHNYAGSSSAGGSANSAVKLDSSAGSATQPVYFSGGKPVATTYTLGKSVPSNAVFTDTWRGIQNNLTSNSTTDSLSAAQGKVLKGLIDGKAASSHTHTKSQITDFPTSMPANGGNAATVGGHTVGVNVPSNAKFTDTNTWRPQPDWNATSGDAVIKNKPSLAKVATSGSYNDLSNKPTIPTIPSSLPANGGTADKVGHALTINYEKGAARIYTFDGSQDVNFDIQIPTTASAVGAVPTSGGTVNGAITFGKSDNYGIRTNTNNFGRVGDATNQFYEGYFYQIFENKTSLSNKYLQLTGDSKDNIVTFTSNDSITGDSTAPPVVITSGETHASLFNKLSTAVKNVRWLLSKMGTTDISSIGNGTVTGALSTLNSNISSLKRVFFFGQAMADLDYGFSATTSAPCHGYAEEIYPNHFNIHLEMKIHRGSEYQNNNQVYEVFAMHFLTQKLGVSTINWNPYATRASIYSNANLITNYYEILGRSGLLVIKGNNDVYQLGRIYDNSTYGGWGHDSGLYKANVGILIDIYDAITS